MKRAVLAISLALSLVFANGVQAAPQTWSIDPSHSQVSFSIRHFFSKVPGQFTKFSGTIVYDAEKPEASSVKAEIDAASINTQNEKRDGHLRSQDFFNVEKFPTINFVSTKVTPVEAGKLKVEGNLTMRGVTKPVTLEVDFLGAGPSMNGESRSGFEATTKVDRKEYQIVWNKALDQGGTLLGDDVDIKLNVEGVIRPDQDPASAPAQGKPATTKKS